MEKFGAWRDKVSGVGPFLPRTKPESTLTTIGRWIFGICKLPLFVLIMIQSYINLVFAYYFPIKFLSRFYTRVHSFVTYYLVMILFGEYWTSIVPTPLVKRLVDDKWQKPGSGDVIFTHLTSYINLFWLQFKLSPTFIIPVDEEHCVVKGVQNIVLTLLRHKNLREGKRQKIADVVADARRNRRGPVVVLCEGAPTNSEGILKFQPFKAQLPEDTKVQVIGFVRPFAGLSPNYTAGNGLVHLIKNLGHIYTSCTVLVALEADVGAPKDDLITPEFVEKMRTVLSRLTKLPTVEIDADAYLGFVEEFYKSQDRAKKFD